MNFVFLLALCASITIAHPTGNIIVYGDVQKDVEFFSRTFPWIIDNIGGNLYMEYIMLGSGRYSVPQDCALEMLMGNAFLQAQYLRCEAEEYPGEYCLCEAGIAPEYFKQCVANGGFRVGLASERFSELGINISPVIDLGANNTVFGLDDIALLKKICTIFDDATMGDADDATMGDADDATMGDADDATMGDAVDATMGDEDDANLGDADNAKLGDADDATMGDEDDANLGDANDANLGDADNAKLGDADDANLGDADDPNLDDGDDAHDDTEFVAVHYEVTELPIPATE
ncbi:hypothetical protein PYW08_006517 [Mythimna loreyi]|uniref:Uncharacterized protein n=1 Tax=Mythimna loreyi TaxID=667449 RepID=A0ACC2QNV4_9NEOP|nr:hypothetical protein PYW08_006517 [Mythimna loreyi]